MTPSTLHLTPGPQRQIDVELGTQQLPPRMRLGGLRRSLRVVLPDFGIARRLVTLPITTVSRIVSR